ncbi:MAG TPA: hypothetical protein VKU00_04650 [Chthonomonadaceae bacterium]|nr:hypothetical protein [Chthonomonadaceae bacterium]
MQTNTSRTHKTGIFTQQGARSPLLRALGSLTFAALTVTLAGCGGGSGLAGNSNLAGGASRPAATTGAEQTLQVGPFLTRAAGAISPPVTAGSSGAVTTGITGTITGLTLNETVPSQLASKIYFMRSQDGVHYSICSANPDGSNITTVVTPANGTLYGSFAVSHHNTLIAYTVQTTDSAGKITSQDIYIAKADGSSPVALTAKGINDSPSFSPDGSKVVFRRLTTTVANGQRSTVADIYTLKLNATQLTNLTNNDGTGVDTYPSFSPDGSKIVYVRPYVQGGENHIYVMNADGSGVTELTGNDRTSWDAPAFSPDGSKIVCIHIVVGNNGTNHDVCLMNSDGSGQTTIDDVQNFSYGDSHPVFSPDSKIVLFGTDFSNGSWLTRVNTDGSNRTYLTKGIYDILPEWASTSPTLPLIGSNGIFGASANGFFYSQQDSTAVLPCLATFTVGTSSTAQLTALSGISAASLLMAFSLQADSITSLTYVNNLVNLTGPINPSNIALPNGTNNALFTFNGTTGQFAGMFSAITKGGPGTFTSQSGGAPGVPLSIFNLQASSITAVNYANAGSLEIPPVNVALGAGINNVLITFSNSTGQLTSVLPFTGTRAAAPQSTFANGACILHGHFTAVYDATGANLAHHGATEVQMDAHTGKLISVR